MDNAAYIRNREEKEAAHEALCRRCGVCCGAFGSDPCGNLVKTADGHFDCTAYSNRLGPQKTRSGHIFTCVTIRDVHNHGVFYPDCAYNP